MHKRILVLALCLCLAVGALPVSAAPETEEGQICQAIVDDYRNILLNTNMESLHGWCGLTASWQLYFLGVNDWVASYHGKDQFDAYCQTAVTSGGHTVETYSYLDYTLEEALNAITKNGTRDAYNLLVGFEKTNTRLGSVYGHSVVIYAILDGTVYYTESYHTEFGPAGTPFRVSIPEFAAHYADWTVFEGIAVFGKKGYAANCKAYPTNLFLELTETAVLYSQPCTPQSGQTESEPVRTVQRGERLWANGLLQNLAGEWFYQIDDSGTAGYLPAGSALPLRFNYEDVGVSNLQLPERIPANGSYTLTGRIASEYSTMEAVEMTVTDMQGNTVIRHALSKRSGVYDLQSDTFRALVDLSKLEPGNYDFRIRAEGVNHYVAQGELLTHSVPIDLVDTRIVVGEGQRIAPETRPQEQETYDGWVYRRGTWYYYEQGTPRTGWYCSNGADYYLKPDGSVTTGWATINGKLRYFSRTGAMRIGWMETEQGTYYFMSNGAPATGWRTIDGSRYFFDEDGLLQ